MAISHKPGINNWNNGRYKNTYTITRDIKYNQPIKVEEQPEIEEIKEEIQAEEIKSTKSKKQWENQNLIPPSGSETNI
jgi:hypothetical protein